MRRHRLLVTTELLKEDMLKPLRRYAEIYHSYLLKENELERILSSVDCMIILYWPHFLTKERMRLMTNLRFIQNILVGVNHIPFNLLSDDVLVCSNAGAYSLEVAEHAIALLLSSAKKIVQHHLAIRDGKTSLSAFSGEEKEIAIVRGKTIGIIGFGGIGRSIARIARCMGMNVLALARRKVNTRGLRVLTGKYGLHRILRDSDFVILSLPLTKETKGIIGREELAIMKENAILVNIARGDLVEQAALYEHMVRNRKFRYATDVWWYDEGKETLLTRYPFTSLPNFIGTPHISGPTSILSGRPAKQAIMNTLRYLKGLTPKNIVNKAEYLIG